MRPILIHIVVSICDASKLHDERQGTLNLCGGGQPARIPASSGSGVDGEAYRVGLLDAHLLAALQRDNVRLLGVRLHALLFQSHHVSDDARNIFGRGLWLQLEDDDMSDGHDERTVLKSWEDEFLLLLLTSCKAGSITLGDLYSRIDGTADGLILFWVVSFKRRAIPCFPSNASAPGTWGRTRHLPPDDVPSHPISSRWQNRWQSISWIPYGAALPKMEDEEYL